MLGDAWGCLGCILCHTRAQVELKRGRVPAPAWWRTWSASSTPWSGGAVDPIKPKLEPPGTKRLKLNCDVLLSTSAFKSNLRRYTVVARANSVTNLTADAKTLDSSMAGAYTRSPLSST